MESGVLITPEELQHVYETEIMSPKGTKGRQSRCASSHQMFRSSNTIVRERLPKTPSDVIIIRVKIYHEQCNVCDGLLTAQCFLCYYYIHKSKALVIWKFVAWMAAVSGVEGTVRSKPKSLNHRALPAVVAERGLLSHPPLEIERTPVFYQPSGIWLMSTIHHRYFLSWHSSNFS